LRKPEESEMSDQSRNLNPHKAARAAMYIWGERYAQQRGGSMDFWDKLQEHEKNVARRLVKEISELPDEALEQPR
jgi:hypothetical protein